MQFLRKQFLPIGLLSAAFVGITLPAPGIAMSRLPTHVVAIVFIFLISGLMLRTDEIKAAIRAWHAALWGCTSILVVTPAVGVAITLCLPLDPELKLGLALFCCMPTTLSSGIALTTTARGNVALALLLTVLTNLGGVFVVPFTVMAAVDVMQQGSGRIELSATALLGKLCLVVLIPLVIGKSLRNTCGRWVDSYHSALATASNAALVLISWMQFSLSSTRLRDLAIVDLLILVVVSLVIHLCFLLLNTGVVRWLPTDEAARRAVILLASQKTLTVALTVVTFLPMPAASKGLAVISCILFHLGQIIVDAFIASHWSARNPAHSGQQ